MLLPPISLALEEKGGLQPSQERLSDTPLAGESISGIYTTICRTAESRTFPLFLLEVKPRIV